MDQSKSTDFIPKRTFTLELIVGVFTLVALAAAGYLAVGLGGIDLNSSNQYYVTADFDNISGLQKGASVEIAGVPIGQVEDISLNGSRAIVKMKIDKTVQLVDDDIAQVRTKGIIGDRFVKISRGASDTPIPNGGKMSETESVVDIEDLIGKFVHNFGSKEEEEEIKTEKAL